MIEQPRDPLAQITEHLDAATLHLAEADALASATATRGGSEQIARLLASAANAAIAGALLVATMRADVDELRDLLAELVAAHEPEHEDDGLDVDGLPRTDWGAIADREHDRWRDEQVADT